MQETGSTSLRVAVVVVVPHAKYYIEYSMPLSSETPETGRLQEKMMLRMMASQATYIPAPCRRVKSMFV